MLTIRSCIFIEWVWVRWVNVQVHNSNNNNISDLGSSAHTRTRTHCDSVENKKVSVLLLTWAHNTQSIPHRFDWAAKVFFIIIIIVVRIFFLWHSSGYIVVVVVTAGCIVMHCTHKYFLQMHSFLWKTFSIFARCVCSRVLYGHLTFKYCSEGTSWRWFTYQLMHQRHEGEVSVPHLQLYSLHAPVAFKMHRDNILRRGRRMYVCVCDGVVGVVMQLFAIRPSQKNTP